MDWWLVDARPTMVGVEHFRTVTGRKTCEGHGMHSFPSSSVRPRGFTLIELILVIAIIVLLIALLVPALSGVQDIARTTQCLSQTGQLSKAAETYMIEQRRITLPVYVQFPRPGAKTWWDALLIEHQALPLPDGAHSADIPSTRSALRCADDIAELARYWPPGPFDGYDRSPDARDEDERRRVQVRGNRDHDGDLDHTDIEYYTHTSYGINGINQESHVFYAPHRWGEGGKPFWHPHHVLREGGNAAMRRPLRLSDLERPPSTIISLFDGQHFHVTSSDMYSARHRGRTKTNVAMLDGSARTLETEDIPSPFYATGRDAYRHITPTHWIN